MPPTRGLLLRWLTDKNSWFRSLIIGSPGLTFSIELLYISWASVRCSAFVPAEVTRNTSTAASPNVSRHPKKTDRAKKKYDDRKKKELYLPNNVKTNLCQ